MKSEALLDPELSDFLASLPNAELSTKTLHGLRAGIIAASKEPSTLTQKQVLVENHSIPGSARAPSVRILSYRPTSASGDLPGLLHLHGGGYVLGAPEMALSANCRLAADADCMIFSVDYRLAPETRYPGALEDCYAALKWLHLNAKSLGVDSTRIGVKGESAGGGLAAALALWTRDRSGPSLAFQHLIYPMLDDRTCSRPDPDPFTGEFVWTRAQNEFGWSALLGKNPGSADVPAFAAAGRVEHLDGLPPTFIGVGSLDLFVDENLSYALRLIRAGVSVEMHVYPGGFHRFYEAPGASIARRAQGDSLDALRRCMHP